jgi:hypothetical protein
MFYHSGGISNIRIEREPSLCNNSCKMHGAQDQLPAENVKEKIKTSENLI